MSSTSLKFIPPRVPLTDPRTGLISREWFLFFQGLFERVGGPLGESTTDLTTSMFEDAGIEEIRLLLFTAAQALQQNPPANDLVPLPSLQDLQSQPTDMVPLNTYLDLQAQVSALQEQLGELGKELQAIKQAVLIT